MKMRFFVSIISVILVSAIFAAGRSKNEELHGTWINEEYKGTTMPFAIQIYKPDGTYQYFRLGASAWLQDVEGTEEGWIKAYSGPYEIIEKWTDEEGNLWYEIEKHYTAMHKLFVLIKISGSGNILEYVFSKLEFAEDIDPNASTYGIFYRQ